MKVKCLDGPERKEFMGLKTGSVFRRADWSRNCLFLKIDNYVADSADEAGRYERYPFNAILLGECSVHKVPPSEVVEVTHGIFLETEEEPE